MQFVIISGMSGAGKSRAASDLEDLGFYCVDNMPAEMIPQFAQLCLATKGRYEKVALVTDIRASMTFDALFQALQKLDDMHLQYSIYYIEASTAVIIKRYKETRRLHPLMKDGSTLENAIARERELTPDEQAERKALREEYIADWRRSTIDVLENTYIDHGDGRVTKLPKKRT